ncbi:MAG: ferredoxin--NADP reductase [Pedobacter sp.]|uniref:ferredoxin--NADP reductase n=1 Tax=Pedobacter sp. TaxID=1411316 RepID=UPI002806DC6A|nr:ferredoxin--NADP reductase [Pedobacter sp.]MDQ8004336.1 ferredoxin--NADP reductase [Pedobacter sp.]
MQTYTLKVVEIRRETADTVTLCFKQPALKKVKYKAGQYLTLIFRINGRRYIRPYSFSSAPMVDSTLDVTIKRVPNGIVSNHINDVVKVGDSIEVMSPMGDFVIPEDNSCQAIFLWGAGSGITPLFSIAKKILHENPMIKVNLVYGNRRRDTVIFSSAINELRNNHSEQLSVWHFHTEAVIDEALPHVVQGRIDAEEVLNSIMELDIRQGLHFICGPIGLKTSVKKSLEKRNVSLDSIFSEDFELIKDPADFKGIHTETIQLNFKGERHSLEIIKGKSILEAGLDANIELPYSCQTGNCSSCKGRVISGQVRMIGLTKQRQDLLNDEYLLCCSYPMTENVIIEI